MADQENKLRISLLYADSDLSPLKFKGWLRTEALDIVLSCRHPS